MKTVKGMSRKLMSVVLVLLVTISVMTFGHDGVAEQQEATVDVIKFESSINSYLKEEYKEGYSECKIVGSTMVFSFEMPDVYLERIHCPDFVTIGDIITGARNASSMVFDSASKMNNSIKDYVVILRIESGFLLEVYYGWRRVYSNIVNINTQKVNDTILDIETGKVYGTLSE